MIELKSPVEIEKMRTAGKIVAEILASLTEQVKPGVTTSYLNRQAEKMIVKLGCRSAFKNYRVGTVVFPAVLCASINEEVVHGIPAERAVCDGDLLKLDFGVEADGYYGDAAVTVAVGDVDEDSMRLLRVTKECLDAGIRKLTDSNRLGDVGEAVQAHAESAGYGVVKDFVGHGIGRALHEDPQVPNFGKTGRGRRIKTGMVLAVEPMINIGGPGVRITDDGWTAVTLDGGRSAHFEHTIAVTDNGPEVLTAL